MICDNCLHADVCGKEGVFDSALTYCADFLGKEELLQSIIDELRLYQQKGDLEKDGWKDIFYNGIEYAIDVIVEHMES